MGADAFDQQHPADLQKRQRAEERVLFERYLRERTPAAREPIVERFLPLARQLARRYAGGGELEDLEQVGALALVKAIERFDPQRGLAFSSFAFPTIAGEIKRYLRDHAWTVRPPRALQERYLRIDRATRELTSELGRAPTANELAARVDATVEEVLETRQAATARRAVSLDQPARGDEEPEPDSVGSLISVEDTGFDAAENTVVLDTLMRDLGERERLLLRLRFQEDLTQSEIGERVGLSQMHVSRLIRGAIERLQQSADETGQR
jgi:RNA polymerase sigma-B factor